MYEITQAKLQMITNERKKNAHWLLYNKFCSDLIELVEMRERFINSYTIKIAIKMCIGSIESCQLSKQCSSWSWILLA